MNYEDDVQNEDSDLKVNCSVALLLRGSLVALLLCGFIALSLNDNFFSETRDSFFGVLQLVLYLIRYYFFEQAETKPSHFIRET